APVMNPNGTYAYAYDTEEKLPTLNARLANSGYQRIRRTDNNILFGAKQNLDFITEGLSASARVAYSTIEENQRESFRGAFPSYHYDAVNDVYTIHPDRHYAYGNYTVLAGQNAMISDLNIQGFLNYETEIALNHNIS